MVWKSDFFSGFMRFVRVPPYENWAFWTNFYFSWENGEFFWGQTCCTLFHTKNEEKSQKISTCIRIHTRVYAITWWWGQICPPPGLIGLERGVFLILCTWEVSSFSKGGKTSPQSVLNKSFLLLLHGYKSETLFWKTIFLKPIPKTSKNWRPRSACIA